MILRLRGGAAHPGFRIRQLENDLREHLPGLESAAAEFWHFVELDAELTAAEEGTLRQLLDYGQREDGAATDGELLIVIPRLGTISPWSTKATDIAHHCGLTQVVRIERGVAWYLRLSGGGLGEGDAGARVARHLHDPMTETVVTDPRRCEDLFRHFEPRRLAVVDVLAGGADALARANRDWGMALSDDEIDYLVGQFSQMKRNPTDVELMMFAQANSEHCRHKIFNARWIIDREQRDRSLFEMIRESHRQNNTGTLVAYKDNAAVLEGSRAGRLFAGPEGLDYRYHDEPVHIVCKVETHNHPTGISPFPGAATGSGGEIRDEGATGTGAKPKAGLTGFTVSNLRIPGAIRPWEGTERKPARLASPLQIMLEGPIGGASFNNEFGRPNIAGYFRTYEQVAPLASGGTETRGYHKPIMLAGGLGNIRPAHVEKRPIPDGAVIVVLGGPAMMIGLGGGAASSVATGAGDEALDFSSVQRGNPEMQRRCQEVIDRCWEMGDDNPVLSIHDIGAGGLSNALPELVHGSGRGAHFQLREVLNDDPGMTPMQIWCNEAQERYALAVEESRLAEFMRLCERERCLYCVVGRATQEQTLLLDDAYFESDGAPYDRPIRMPMQTLFGKPPAMTRDVRAVAARPQALNLDGVDLREALERVLLIPSVADKTFLVTIGDRSVGGLVCRDQMVGPWQVPVADVAVTAAGFTTHYGEAMAIGERTPLAVVDAPASGRMAVVEALLNLAAADIRSLNEVKLSANWMVAAGHPGEDAALFETVRGVAVELCPALGVSIPVGKDSMSMKTIWADDEGEHQVTAPLSLVVSAFAPVDDVRKTVTPVAVPDADSEIFLIDLGEGRNRLGGSALAQAFGQIGDAVPDADDPGLIRAALLAIRELVAGGLISAYHDRSDGGLAVALLEMSFAGRTGLDIDLGRMGNDRSDSELLALLFNEEPGAVIQVSSRHQAEVTAILKAHGLDRITCRTAVPRRDHRIRIADGERVLLDSPRSELHRLWSETTWRMQSLRDNSACADEEYDRILDENDPGLFASLSYEPSAFEPPALLTAPPRVAVLREQGVNGHVEMAAAFMRAGFAAADVTMQDLLHGRHTLSDFQGLAVCGGFSFGDVLGAGGGWAKSILFNDDLREQFRAFFEREDAVTLGVCNGCQMLAGLKELIPGAGHWPRFVRNRSEQFEARFVMVEVTPGPSVLTTGMHGSRLPVVVSHGEGRVACDPESPVDRLRGVTALRFIDNYGDATETYPCNPNGSPLGITGLSNDNGRVTIMMPHPERVFRKVQCSWAPDAWGEDSGWMRLFRNAREFV